MDGEFSPDSVMAPVGFGASKRIEPSHMPCKATASTDAPKDAEEWDCVAQYAELTDQGAIDIHDDPASAPATDFVLCESGLVSDHKKSTHFYLWTADGFASSAPLRSADLLFLEKRFGAPEGTLCKIYFAAFQTPNDAAEPSFDPSARFNALPRAERRMRRGHKDAAHEETLRQSDPTFGSLAPGDHPSRAELSYVPQRRYAAMAWADQPARGAKSAEHLEILRTSDPTFGSLAPSDRPNRAELSYNPSARWAQLARFEKQPRGAKSAEHLAVLRTSDPSYGTLLPRRLQAARTQVAVASLTQAGDLGRFLAPAHRNDSWQCLDSVASSGVGGVCLESAGLPAAAAAVAAADGAPRHEAVEWPEEVSDDDEEGVDILPHLPWRASRPSLSMPRDSDSSALSAARTWEGRDRPERESNDTIASFLEEGSEGSSHHGSLSGEWAAFSFSPRHAAKPGLASKPKLAATGWGAKGADKGEDEDCDKPAATNPYFYPNYWAPPSQ